MRGNAIGQRDQANHMLQQAAEPRVVQLPGSGSLTVSLRQAGSPSKTVNRRFRSGSVKLSTHA